VRKQLKTEAAEGERKGKDPVSHEKDENIGDFMSERRRTGHGEGAFSTVVRPIEAGGTMSRTQETNICSQ